LILFKSIILVFFIFAMASSVTVVDFIVKVKWDANIEEDLAGYIVYMSKLHNSWMLVDSVVAESTFVNLGNYGFFYGDTGICVVTAYDYSGNESLPSFPVMFVVMEDSATILVPVKGRGINKKED